MAQSPIQPKKQDNKKSSGGGVWTWWGNRELDKIWNGGVGSIGVRSSEKSTEIKNLFINITWSICSIQLL